MAHHVTWGYAAALALGFAFRSSNEMVQHHPHMHSTHAPKSEWMVCYIDVI